MKREFSAGGIVFKKVKNQKSKIKSQDVLWLVVQHSQHRGWVFPKGLVGDTIDNESKEGTAVREVKEEGGVKAQIVNNTPIMVIYWYRLKGEKIHKTVYYYLMEYVSGDIKDHDHEVSEALWLRTDEVKAKLTFQNDRKNFIEALKLFEIYE